MINFPPTREEIAACAYFIYLNEGCPSGREEEHWRQAEEQLVADKIHDAILALKESGRPEEESPKRGGSSYL
jgi:hypothetical protein